MSNNLSIERLWLDNNLRNYNYIALCQASGEAFVIDPLASDQILDLIQTNHWQVKAVINTHEHGDHIAGNKAIMAATGAPLFAPKNAKINNVSKWIAQGDELKLGKSNSFKVIDTPGHTFTHISLLSNAQNPDLLCGDTIFNAGAGNIHSGDAEILFDTFENKLLPLNPKTKIYPGHDYMQTNLEFTLDLEPDNTAAAQMLTQIKTEPAQQRIVTSLAQERDYNTFLRLDHPDLIHSLRERFSDLGESPSRKSIFLKLRQLRNRW